MAPGQSERGSGAAARGALIGGASQRLPTAHLRQGGFGMAPGESAWALGGSNAGLVIRGASLAFDASVGNQCAGVDEWSSRCEEHCPVSRQGTDREVLHVSLAGRAASADRCWSSSPGAGPSVRPPVFSGSKNGELRFIIASACIVAFRWRALWPIMISLTTGA